MSLKAKSSRGAPAQPVRGNCTFSNIYTSRKRTPKAKSKNAALTNLRRTTPAAPTIPELPDIPDSKAIEDSSFPMN